MNKFISQVALVFSLVFLGWLVGYHTGESHQKTVYVTQQAKANEKVIKQNDEMQKASDKEAEIQIVYKDRIVTKYQTITKEIVKYEENPASHAVLDTEFVRLHNAAASDIQTQATPDSNESDGASPAPEVTTGEAISVIADNYKSFYECKAKVEGWQRFYSDLQKTLSE